jgi:hypothetical protein
MREYILGAVDCLYYTTTQYIMKQENYVCLGVEMNLVYQQLY